VIELDSSALRSTISFTGRRPPRPGGVSIRRASRSACPGHGTPVEAKLRPPIIFGCVGVAGQCVNKFDMVLNLRTAKAIGIELPTSSSVNAPGDFGIALVGFVLLTVWRAPPLLVVVVSALGGMVLALANG
jgi:hypothetical protein